MGREIISSYVNLILFGFFVFFFVIYAGKYGLSDMILKGETSHEILFNIGVWFVLVMYCADKFFDELFGTQRIKQTKKTERRQK